MKVCPSQFNGSGWPGQSRSAGCCWFFEGGFADERALFTIGDSSARKPGKPLVFMKNALDQLNDKTSAFPRVPSDVSAVASPTVYWRGGGGVHEQIMGLPAGVFTLVLNAVSPRIHE